MLLMVAPSPVAAVEVAALLPLLLQELPVLSLLLLPQELLALRLLLLLLPPQEPRNGGHAL